MTTDIHAASNATIKKFLEKENAAKANLNQWEQVAAVMGKQMAYYNMTNDYAAWLEYDRVANAMASGAIEGFKLDEESRTRFWLIFNEASNGIRDYYGVRREDLPLCKCGAKLLWFMPKVQAFNNGIKTSKKLAETILCFGECEAWSIDGCRAKTAVFKKAGN